MNSNQIKKYKELTKKEKIQRLKEILFVYPDVENDERLTHGCNVNDYIYPNNTILVPKKDVKYYFTKKDDTIASVNKLLNANINKLLRENNNIYLSEGQLIVYKD